MARPTREYLQWLEENNFSPEDEALILKTATRMTLLWFLLSCIPTLGIFALPLLINAWTQRKIVKQKSFEPRPGLLFSLFAIAMYISYILIIPWIFAAIARKAFWGSGLRKLIKQGKVGNGYTAEGDSVDPSAAACQSQRKGSHFPWAAILIVVVLILAIVAVFTLFPGAREPAQPGVNTEPNGTGSHSTSSGSQEDVVMVPDFSAAVSVDEVQSIAQGMNLTLHVEYEDAAGNIYDSIPDGMMIDSITQNPVSGNELAPGSAVQLQVILKPMYSLTGYWYQAEYTYGSLYLAEYHFAEDGTFSYYYMGYMAVDYETDLYTYGTYWAGAMGADSYAGTYTVNGNQLELSYEFWDWGTETNQHTTAYYSFNITETGLTLNNEAAGISSQYLPGRQPDPDAVLPFRIDGSWYALGTPENGDSLPVHTFYFFSNGEFKSYDCFYHRDNNGWYFPGAGSTFVGTYTFDGTTLVLHYTKELSDVYNNDGDIVGTESIPHDETHTLVLTISDNQVTNVACDGLKLTCLIQIDPSPYVNVDIMGQPLDHANQLYP